MPKLSSGLLVVMVLFPCIEDGDATQGTKLFLLYNKYNNPNNKPLWVPNPWANSLQGKKSSSHMYERIKEKKRGRGKNTTLKNPIVDASPDDQGVNIKVNMWDKQVKTMKVRA